MEEMRNTMFQVDYSRETGQIRLMIETDCGLRPVIGWPDVKSFQDFAVSLFHISNRIYSDRDKEDVFNEWLKDQFEE